MCPPLPETAIETAIWSRSKPAHSPVSPRHRVKQPSKQARWPSEMCLSVEVNSRRSRFEVLAHAILSRVPYQQVGVDDGDRKVPRCRLPAHDLPTPSSEHSVGGARAVQFEVRKWHLLETANSRACRGSPQIKGKNPILARSIDFGGHSEGDVVAGWTIEVPANQ